MDSIWWFVAAVVVCGLHALYLSDWQRESRARVEQWRAYDAASQKRHDEFMAEMRRRRGEAVIGSVPMTVNAFRRRKDQS